MASSQGTSASQCYICTPQHNTVEQNMVGGIVGRLSFALCYKHNQDEVNQKVKEVVGQRLGSGGTIASGPAAQYQPGPAEGPAQDVGGTTLVTSIENVLLQMGTQAADPNPSPVPESTVQVPYRPADYVMQNLPPGRSDPASISADQLKAEDLVRYAYVSGQLQIAREAIGNAYVHLKDVKKEELAARTIGSIMRGVRDNVAEMMKLIEEAESAETG